MAGIRVSAIVQQAVGVALGELHAAAGTTAADRQLLSRAEQATLPAELREAAEAARAANPGRRLVTDAALSAFQAELEGAIAQVNQTSGSGRAFLSREEVAALVARRPALGQRVQNAITILTQPAPPPPARATGAQLAAELQAKCGALRFDGLLGSEGGEPMRAVIVANRAFAPPLTAGTFASAFQIDTSTDQGFIERNIRLGPTTTLLQDLIDANPQAAQDARDVVATLRQLSELRAFVVGKDGAPGVPANHPTYILGIAPDGALVGLKTGVIWT